MIAHAQLEASKARVDQAKAGITSAHADRNRVAMRSADAQAKLAKVDQARAAVEAAQLNLSYSNIIAPVDGVATHKQVEPGQIVQPGQGLARRRSSPGCVGHCQLQGNATQENAIQDRRRTSMWTPTAKPFSGHVDSLAGATGAVMSLLPPENATGNYVKVVQRIPVKIILDPISPNVAILRPGMNVDVTVITRVSSQHASQELCLRKLQAKLRMPDGSINPWVIAITVTLATFMEVLDTSIANVALPHIAWKSCLPAPMNPPGC